MALGEPERREVEHAQRVRQPDQGRKRIDRKRPRPADLNQDRRAHQQGHEHDPRGDERREAGAQIRSIDSRLPTFQLPKFQLRTGDIGKSELDVSSHESMLYRSAC